jgi:glycosyltransferase involved in cell wall biosynthesis
VTTNSTKRFAVFSPDMAGGGAERAALQLAGGLAGRGHPTDLVLASAVGPRMAEISEQVNVVDLGAKRVLGSLPALVRYLREAKPDAMVSMLNHSNVVALWARRIAGHPKRLAVVEQNNLSTSAANALTFQKRMMPRVINLFYPWADVVAGVSAGVLEDLKSHATAVDPQRFRVLYNPIVADDIPTKAAEPVEHPWFQGDDQVFVAAGRYRPQKDFPTLIRAFAKVRTSRPARLVILGDGPERPRLEALVEELAVGDDVDLYGYTDNPYAFFSNATAFILSSQWEGLPTVLIEALSCGTPVVATDCPNGPREILAGGRYGHLLPMADVDALATGLELALEGKIAPPPRESWTPYTLDAVVDDYLAAFAEMD